MTVHNENPVQDLIRQFLTTEEQKQILVQFQADTWIPNGQVLWSGMLQQEAQTWADERHLQTLTTAMGSLMDPGHPSCPRRNKSSRAWSKYVHGASVLFAQCISHGNVVTVLSPPPPQRFHPSGQTHYQSLEEPILKGVWGGQSVERIEMVHPSVEASKDFRYKVWPVDDTDRWSEQFASMPFKKQCWRSVKTKAGISPPKAVEAGLRVDNLTVTASGVEKGRKLSTKAARKSVKRKEEKARKAAGRLTKSKKLKVDSIKAKPPSEQAKDKRAWEGNVASDANDPNKSVEQTKGVMSVSARTQPAATVLNNTCQKLKFTVRFNIIEVTPARFGGAVQVKDMTYRLGDENLARSKKAARGNLAREALYSMKHILTTS